MCESYNHVFEKITGSKKFEPGRVPVENFSEELQRRGAEHTEKKRQARLKKKQQKRKKEGERAWSATGAVAMQAYNRRSYNDMGRIPITL